MRKLREEHRHLVEGKRLEEAQAEFLSASASLLEANRSARNAGQLLTNDMQEKAEYLKVAEQRLMDAEREFDQAIGGPEPVEVTDLVKKKLQESFPPKLHAHATGIVATGCTWDLAFINTAEGLERVQLAVVKLANGSLPELRRQVDIAKVDWRDVINAAEYPEATSLGLVNYSKLDEKARKELQGRDRAQYVAWLGKRETSSWLRKILSKLPT